MTIDITTSRPLSAESRPPRIRRSVILPQHASDRSFPPRLTTFEGLADHGEHIALVWGPCAGRPVVRIHSECLTGDVFDSARCDCGRQLSETCSFFQKNGGVLLYLRQEGRGIGLYNKIDAYALQDRGTDTVDANLKLGFPADARRYDVAAQMLLALGMPEVDLITNNPDKVIGLDAAGIQVVNRVGTGIFLCGENRGYLETKKARMGHLLDLDEPMAVGEAG